MAHQVAEELQGRSIGGCCGGCCGEDSEGPVMVYVAPGTDPTQLASTLQNIQNARIAQV